MGLHFILVAVLAWTMTNVAPQLAESHPAQESPDIFYGNWVVDIASLHTDPSLATHKCYVERMEPDGKGKFRTRNHRMRNNGVVVLGDEHNAFDGVDRPTHQPNVTIAYTITAPRTYQMLVRQGGAVITVVTREVSPDGKTMSHLGQGVLDGKPFTNQFVFVRSAEPRSGECHID